MRANTETSRSSAGWSFYDHVNTIVVCGDCTIRYSRLTVQTASCERSCNISTCVLQRISALNSPELRIPVETKKPPKDPHAFLMLRMLSVSILTMFLSLPPFSSSADPSQECGPAAQDFTTTPTFNGSMLGIVTDRDEVGSLIMVIEAVTADNSSQMTYELVENPGNYFALDKTTGNLTIARQLDRVAPTDPFNVLVLTVRAASGNN